MGSFFWISQIGGDHTIVHQIAKIIASTRSTILTVNQYKSDIDGYKFIL